MLEFLKRIEKEYRVNPHLVWEHLVTGDLLVTQGGTNLYIICVDRFIPTEKLIKVLFIYSIRTDTFYNDQGFESPEVVLRSPSNTELRKLKSNRDYQTYISKNNG